MTSAVSCSRLRQIQSLLRDGGSTAPDAILCSLGIDSRYNEGCTELANYLFFGLYKQTLLDVEQDLPEEVLDDVIVLIKANSVHLYCNPVNYGYLLPYVSHWRNLHLHCMTETEYEDEEAAEEFKISSFVSMVQDCRRIGVPYSSQGHIQKFDMFMVEKWPIIQAFALEGIGAGGFFTMKYKLWGTYTRLDPVSLEHLFTEELVGFEKQWNNFFSAMDRESHLSIPELSEAQAGEYFRIYFSHGLISSNITDTSKSRQPFTLFGNHSSKAEMESYCFTFPSEGHQVRNTGPQGTNAKHMILQCVSPTGPLACARTYFFGTAHIPYLGKLLYDGLFSVFRLLSQIYAAVVQAVLAAIKCFSYKSSTSKVLAVTLMQYILPSCMLWSNGVDYRLMCFVQASMTVYNIPDLYGGSGDLGSVVFSESFLESSIYIQDKGMYAFFSAPHAFCFMINVLMQSHTMICDASKLVYFSEGLLFIHPQYGSITISKNHIRKLSLYDGDSFTALALLYVDFESSLLPYLPFPLHSHDLCLGLGLLPKTKSYRSLYSKVLQTWHCSDSTLQLQLVERDQLSVEQLNIAGEVRTALKCTPINLCTVLESNLCVFARSFFFLRFLEHFALSSSVCDEHVCSEHLEALFPNTNISTVLPKRRPKVVVSIIAGLPGSHKESLCDFLLNVNREAGRWAVYHPPPDSSGLCVSHLHRFFSSLLENLKEPEGAHTCPCKTVQCILSNPDVAVRRNIAIGAITSCVNPLSSYMEHRFLLPKLLEQCSQGVVSNVAFTGLTEQKHPLLQNIQQLIRSVNPNAAFILAERGAITRIEDMRLVLSENSFVESQMIRSRYLLYPGWYEGKFVCGSGSVSISQLCLQFSRPLERDLFLDQCKGEIISSLKSSPFKGNVYHIRGEVRFTDSDRLMQVCFNTLSGNLALVPVDQDPTGAGVPPCFLLVDCVGLTDEGLKDWLRLCAKQKLVKKVKKNRWSLSQKELIEIHERRHLDPLPPGYYFNGIQYVSFYGEKSSRHPLMERFIEEYVEEVNKEVERFNKELELQEKVDLFNP
uniref:Uncharacterized protein n=1 Tax=Denticeps clupeoides TaxID=299321 RepID=A0AAY4EQE3_9TELE